MISVYLLLDSYLLVYIPEKTNLLVCPYPVHSSTSKFFDTVDELDIFQLLDWKISNPSLWLW